MSTRDRRGDANGRHAPLSCRGASLTGVARHRLHVRGGWLVEWLVALVGVDCEGADEAAVDEGVCGHAGDDGEGVLASVVGAEVDARVATGFDDTAAVGDAAVDACRRGQGLLGGTALGWASPEIVEGPSCGLRRSDGSSLVGDRGDEAAVAVTPGVVVAAEPGSESLPERREARLRDRVVETRSRA